MKNDKWFKEILSQIKFGKGFPVAKFYFHPLYRVGVGKDSNLDYIFGRHRRAPLKNLRKLTYFSFEAPLPKDSVIFFQPERERLIVASKLEGKVLKISVSPKQLTLLQGEIQELVHQNKSEFAPYTSRLLDSGSNWIMTSFCSNRDSVAKMDILDLHQLLIGPMTKFYLSHGVKKISLKDWLVLARKRSIGHPYYDMLVKFFNKLDESDNFDLLYSQLHFDLHHGNVLRDGDKITIIDWEVTHPGLVLVDYFDFYRRWVNKRKIRTEDLLEHLSESRFYSGFKEWLESFGISLPDNCQKTILQLYALERTLIYYDKWKENRLEDKEGFEYKIASLP